MNNLSRFLDYVFAVGLGVLVKSLCCFPMEDNSFSPSVSDFMINEIVFLIKKKKLLWVEQSTVLPFRPHLKR